MKAVWLARSVLSLSLCITAMGVWSATAQTLLESWVYLEYHGEMPIDKLKESKDGTLVAPKHPNIHRGGSEVWSVEDRKNCVIRVENFPLGLIDRYYLRNMSTHRPMIQKRDGTFQISLWGDNAVKCRESMGEVRCRKEITLFAFDADGYRRIESALNYIYQQHCEPAKVPARIR